MDNVMSIIHTQYVNKKKFRQSLETFLQHLVDKHDLDYTKAYFRVFFPMIYTEQEIRQENPSNGISWYMWPWSESTNIPIIKHRKKIKKVYNEQPEYTDIFVYCEKCYTYYHTNKHSQNICLNCDTK